MTDGVIAGRGRVPLFGAARTATARAITLSGLAEALRAAIAAEEEQLRFFLWMPVLFGAGISLYFAADREPSLPLTVTLALAITAAAAMLRRHRRAHLTCVALAAVCAGMASAGLRSASLAAPVIERPRVATIQGYIEEIDVRREGARFVLRVAASDELERLPYRVRLTTRRTPGFEAGAFVELKARLLPPSRAAEPGGYDFARDAWFARIGAVGNVLGRIEEARAPEQPGFALAATMAIDRARNALAARVDSSVGGDAGAIAAAMVTGKRDLLSETARELIREAGIFHVITIAGVQMTLVAGIFFVGLRRLLALSRTLALHYPIKKWAAAAAIVAAIAYDVMTGSRIGTERALIMTLIMLGAVLLDRRALTMRNLALAALVVLALQPEALLGASFQLSFAAVAGLIAVHEARRVPVHGGLDLPARPRRRGLGGQRGHGLRDALIATACASAATASFMACDFHELNPYVLVGNPLTLAVIEIFAVPGALVGTLLYPLGLDGAVWHWVGLGINLIMWLAKLIAALPGARVHLPTFAAFALPFLALAVLSAVIWRTAALRLTAVPFAMIGIAGAFAGPSFDVAVAADGGAIAVREADGHLAVIGPRPSPFAAEQWLRGDGDGREAALAISRDSCDPSGCIARLADGRVIALVLDRSAFAEDCQRAAIVVSPLWAPEGCAAATVLDRPRLRQTGAMTLAVANGGFSQRSARAVGEDRPWSPAPPQPWSRRSAGGSH